VSSKAQGIFILNNSTFPSNRPFSHDSFRKTLIQSISHRFINEVFNSKTKAVNIFQMSEYSRVYKILTSQKKMENELQIK